MAPHVHADPLQPGSQPDHSLGKTFWATVGLIIVIAVGAWRAHSLALWADAGHALTDLAAIGLSWYAFRQVNRLPTERMSFGFARTEVLVAFFNGLFLVAVAIGLIIEAIRQWAHPVAANTTLMMATAAVALVIYGGLALTFTHHRDLNLQGMWLHLMSDAASSLGVLIGAVILAWTGWMEINPLLTGLIAIGMLISTWHIFKEALGILMEATPPGVDLKSIASALEAVDGVNRIHDLHVWRIGSGQTALACHVGVKPEWHGRDSQIMLCELHDALDSIGINHVTIQLEHGDETHHEPW